MAINRSKQISKECSPEQLASDFLNEFRASGACRRDVLDRLIRLATDEEAKTAEQASRAFFSLLVERLADSFEPASVSLYNRAFAHLIKRCRSTRCGELLDRELKRRGLETEDDLISRAESLRQKQSSAWLRDAGINLKRIIVLSRVTLGADVAITSVIIERMKQSFPTASITLVGGRKAAELFGGDHRLSFKEISYRRAGTAIEKLLSWTEVLTSVREATDDLKRGEYLIVDPDSRLTQLGLLPVTRAEDDLNEYLFFPSREYRSDTTHSLGHLASLWLDDTLSASERVYPRVSLTRDDLDTANELIKRMRLGSARPVVTINFGVGENPLKRIGDDFEQSLASRLIEDGARVILDKGAGEDETRYADAIINNVKHATTGGRGVQVIETDEASLNNLLSSERLDADVVVWSGRIGLLAALISKSDLYIGYDSAGQHIAAALGVPCIDVFAGYSSPRMLDRWRPTGKAETRIVAVDAAASERAVLSDVLRHAREMLKNRSQESEVRSQNAPKRE